MASINTPMYKKEKEKKTNVVMLNEYDTSQLFRDGWNILRAIPYTNANADIKYSEALNTAESVTAGIVGIKQTVLRDNGNRRFWDVWNKPSKNPRR